jgi:hypothetical protein
VAIIFSHKQRLWEVRENPNNIFKDKQTEEEEKKETGNILNNLIIDYATLPSFLQFSHDCLCRNRANVDDDEEDIATNRRT